MSNLPVFDYRVLDGMLKAGHWREILQERQVKEVRFAEMYRNQFGHGTTGHNQLIIIADLSHLLDYIVTNFELVRKD